MLLSCDCVRDVLLAVEDLSQVYVAGDNALVFTQITPKAICEKVNQYSEEEIYYAAYMLCDAGYLRGLLKKDMSGKTSISILHITYAGHTFLDSVRDVQRWNSAKRVLSSIRDYSLSALQAVASGITDAAISRYFMSQQGK